MCLFAANGITTQSPLGLAPARSRGALNPQGLFITLYIVLGRVCMVLRPHHMNRRFSLRSASARPARATRVAYATRTHAQPTERGDGGWFDIILSNLIHAVPCLLPESRLRQSIGCTAGHLYVHDLVAVYLQSPSENAAKEDS